MARSTERTWIKSDMSPVGWVEGETLFLCIKLPELGSGEYPLKGVFEASLAWLLASPRKEQPFIGVCWGFQSPNRDKSHGTTLRRKIKGSKVFLGVHVLPRKVCHLVVCWHCSLTAGLLGVMGACPAPHPCTGPGGDS